MISKEVLKILSLKKINSTTIDKRIANVEDRIKDNLTSIFSDVETGRNVGYDLIKLANLKDVKLLMNSQPYQVYEKKGKEMPYEDFLNEWYS